jgi:hypothetical protein
MKKEPIDPKDTPAYNHYRIGGTNKPVIPNKIFNDTLSSNHLEVLKQALSTYAMDVTQTNLIEQKIKKLEN